MNKSLLEAIFFSIIGASFVITIMVVMTDRYSIEVKMESNSKTLYRYDLSELRKLRNDTNVSNYLMYPDATNRCENNHTRLPEKTIIIVPYRNRTNNLKLFLPYLHHILNKQV